MIKLNTEALLACKMGKNDAGAKTVRGYLKQLLTTLFEEGEGFSGKRPFGNSCWEHEIWAAWISEGLMPGELDTEGYVMEYNQKKFFEAIHKCIATL